MKRWLTVLLIVAILFNGCAHSSSNVIESYSSSQDEISNIEEQANSSTDISEKADIIQDESEITNVGDTSSEGLEAISRYEYHPDFEGLDSADLLGYVEDTIYDELLSKLNNDDYFVENVSAVYVSKEYLEELEYNSRSNIFFGYSIEEIQKAYGDKKFVFKLGDDGNTIVAPFEDYDDTWDNVIKNVAIGTGVILVCVTVSVVSGGVGAPAISLIFSASAKTGTIMALSSGALGGVASGVITGIQTGDMNEAIKAAALAGSEGFKWGAISGAVAGGVSEAIALKGATLNGLTMNEAATIQKESKYPLDVIKQFKNMEQYKICKEAGLTAKMVNGKTALIRTIDLNYIDDATGLSNLQLMQQGKAAIDPISGLPYELHHIGQKADSTLAILTKAEHMQNGNNTIWHVPGSVSEVHGPENTWDSQRIAFWKNIAEIFGS